MPPEPALEFLTYIHERYRELRGNDKLPDSLEAWQAQKKTLREKLLASWGGFPDAPCPLDAKTLGEFRRGGYRVERIVFQTRPGVWMTANAYVPDQNGKHPAVLCVHGHWKGAKQDTTPQSRCIGLAKLGFFVLAVDAFGAGERGIGKALGEYHGEMVGATLFPVGLPLSGLQVYENMRAVDYLQSRPEVDGTKIGITGASGGGNQTMYAGAFDERFGCVVPVCSVGTYRAYLGAACCVCEVVPDAMTYTEEWALLSMVAPRALMVVNATRDAFQFSVGEAQQSIARAQHVFRLHGQAGKVAHSIFESGHDYGKAMREAMYGWMTLHLKGEGQGNPIAEPAHATEDPETLRCYPGTSRPDDYITLPRFAAREADRLVAGHSARWPDHREHWNNLAMQMRHRLASNVLGGEPKTPGAIRRKLDQHSAILETEPGVEVAVALERDSARTGRTALLVDLDGSDHARETELARELRSADWDLAFCDLRATGRYAVAGDAIGRAPDHNSAEWSIWTGRPLLGQWAWDLKSAIRWLKALSTAAGEKETGELTLFGIGPAGLVALVAAIAEPGIARTVLTGPIATFRSDVPYTGQRMGLFAPRILRDVGDVAHLAALVAPQKLVIAGAVSPAGEALEEAALKSQFAPTRAIYRLLGVDAHLTVAAIDNPGELVRRLSG